MFGRDHGFSKENIHDCHPEMINGELGHFIYPETVKRKKKEKAAKFEINL